ncbi:MAG: hypothetical protein K9I68_03140 [Bacteroidales bacterium]|nr:hypothetical protein [Bacteroidales bacterium]MCF8336852.1 hypothetical protein [Bacteroidales bacterium]
MKRILILTFFSAFCLVTSAQSFSYYKNWHDLNLQNKPEYVTEISTFSLEDLYEMQQLDSIEYTFSSMSSVRKYAFDSSGRITKKYRERIPDNPGKWIHLKNSHKKNTDDSTYIYDTIHDGTSNLTKKLYFDQHGFLTKLIRIRPLKDTTIYSRDSNHRIIKIYNHSFGIDTETISKNYYELNSHGDKKVEERYTKHHFLNFSGETKTDRDTFNYRYIYDSKSNWIIRTKMKNDSIIKITEREIEY